MGSNSNLSPHTHHQPEVTKLDSRVGADKKSKGRVGSGVPHEVCFVVNLRTWIWSVDDDDDDGNGGGNTCKYLYEYLMKWWAPTPMIWPVYSSPEFVRTVANLNRSPSSKSAKLPAWPEKNLYLLRLLWNVYQKALWAIKTTHDNRVAEVGSPSARAKMAIKIVVWRVFATNSSFLRIIANLQI